MQLSLMHWKIKIFLLIVISVSITLCQSQIIRKGSQDSSVLFIGNRDQIQDTPVFLFEMNARLPLQAVYSRIPSGWKVEDEQLAKFFSPNPFGLFPQSETTFGQSLIVDIAGRYFAGEIVKREKLSFNLKLKAIGKYNSNILSQPVNDEHRLQKNNRYATLDQLQVKYSENLFSLRLFSGIGNQDWRDDRDLFGLVPEQFDAANYKRISGRCVPTGVELMLNTAVGNLQVICGPELMWGDGHASLNLKRLEEFKNNILGKYTLTLGSAQISAMYKDNIILWGRKDERLREGEISFKTVLDMCSRLDIAVLYRPFRLGWQYNYVSEVPLGQGVDSTKFSIQNGRTEGRDAFGGTIIFQRAQLPFFDLGRVAFTYAGIVAGNKTEVSIRMLKRVAQSTDISIEGMYRAPLQGPNPYIFEGTINNQGPTILSPRGKNDPFWVTRQNRKTLIASVQIDYDPTPETWFFKFRPDILDEWNVSPYENAPFAFALRYSISHFPTSTDLQTYINAMGETVWESSSVTGMWPTEKPIHFFEFLGRLSLSEKFLRYIILKLKAGQSLATGGAAYGSSTLSEKPITNLFQVGLSGMLFYDLEFGITIGRSVWGPEDWHQRFGQSIDRLLKIYLHIPAFSNSTLGLTYTSYREVDNKYLAPELGPFDEMVLTYTYNFGLKKIF